MKILFYGAKDDDQHFFDKLAPEYPGITFKFIEANLYEETASLAKGYRWDLCFCKCRYRTLLLWKISMLRGSG